MGGETIQPTVTFPPATKITRPVLERLPADAKKLVRKATVPVLVPPDGVKPESIVVIVEPEFYAVSAKTETGASISVQGTRSRVRYDDVPAAAGRTQLHEGLRGFVTENEGIHVASWVENEVAYSVDLECASPDDALCKDDEGVIQMAKQLVFVGGGGLK